ncbi:MAG: PaaI family thioesterase [Hyphomicrobiaceae bacterium]
MAIAPVDAPWTPHDVAAVTALIDQHFPQARDDVGAFVIEELSHHCAIVRLPIDAKFIRPGGSVSGPTMFKIADLGAWIAILSKRGPAGVDAVTATLTINFLARPEPADLICKTRLLRLGRRLAMAECQVYSDGRTDMVAHATCSYAMPIG